MEYRLGLYEKATPASLQWRERLEAVRQAGFDYLEISIDETSERQKRLDWTREEKSALKDAMNRAELPIRSMCLSAHRKYALGSPDAKIRSQGMKIMEKALQFSADMGIRLIQLAGYDVFYQPSTPETERRFTENLFKCAELASIYGVQLGFETMDTPFMNTTAKAMQYVQLVRSPYLGIYPDIGNLTNAAKQYQDSVTRDLEMGDGHLLAMHMKETVPGKDRGIPFGQGHVDFVEAAKCALSLGVRRFVAECWDDGSENWQERIAGVNRFVRNALESACSALSSAPKSLHRFRYP